MNIPIAMLHHVADDPHPSLKGWTISRQKFLDFLDCIEDKKYQTTTFEEIFKLNLSPKNLKDKIVLTFDDCPMSLFDFAIPELIKRKMKAVFYIPTAHIGGLNVWDIEEHGTTRVDVMGIEQLKLLSQLGMEIGSHGENHLKLNHVAFKTALNDITNSKKNLEKILEKKHLLFRLSLRKNSF